MSKLTLKIGTRGSKLALWQAKEVKRLIENKFPEIKIEIIVIKTKGDKILDVSLSKIGDKGLFTKEIESVLLNGDIDMAVHSLKDMPTELPTDLCIGAILKREDVRDIFISKDGRKLHEMTSNDKIGTSSLRRKAQLLAYNPKLNVVDIRGNVDTRLQRMNDGLCNAIIMAGAGFIRLGYQDKITEFIDERIILPAVSQGAVAVEIRENDESINYIMNAICDDNAWIECMAERWLLRILEGGCQVPVACMSKVKNNNFEIEALVASIDGTKIVREKAICNIEEASEVAIELANKILDKGAKQILDTIRK